MATFAMLVSARRFGQAGVKTLMAVLQIIFLVALMSGQAAATPTLSLLPDFQKMHPPQNLFVDVVISGLQSGGTNTLLGAFDLTIQFDPNVLSLLTGAPSGLGTGLGNPTDPSETLVGANIPSPGTFNFFEVSLLEGSASTCIFCIGPYLEDLQGDTFSLATLAFFAPGSSANPSFTNILITDAVLGDANGDPISNPIIRNASVAVPEPSSFLLLMGGLVAFGFLKRRITLG
jgi:hypothetical protein